MDNEPNSLDGLLQRVWEWAGTSATFPHVAVGLLIAGVLAVCPGFTTLLFVAGGKVIPWWMAGGALLAASAVLVGVQVSARSSVSEDDAFRWSELQNRWFWFPLALCAVFSVFGLVSDAWDRAGYSVVSRNSAGCTLIAKETSFFLGGSGVMYLAEPSGVAHRVGSWKVDEGGRPARDGQVGVSWAGSSVTYRVDGALYGPDAGYGKGRCWTEAVRDRLGRLTPRFGRAADLPGPDFCSNPVPKSRNRPPPIISIIVGETREC